MTELVSLGEQPHDPTHCHRGGWPHLGPCIDLTDTRMAAYRAARAWATQHNHPQPDDRMIKAALLIEALEEGPLIPYPINPLRPENMNYLIDPSAEAELNRLRAALRLCEHVLHRAQPCDAMMHAAQQAAGAHSTDWTLADVADDLAPDTVLDVDDPEIDWNEVRWND